MMEVEEIINRARAEVKLTPLSDRIRETDELIDQIVYRLYGLVEEEVKVVEVA